MVSESDSSRSSKRGRANEANSTPVGAQAEASRVDVENTVATETAVQVGRSQRERARQNAIQAVGSADTSRTANPDRRAREERDPTDSQLRAMPEHIAIRYSRVGDDYHFPDGNVAFRDQGDRLSTRLENTEVIRDLIAIAQARGWSIEITGSKEFRRRAWQEAQVAGLTVRNYDTTELERQQLARRLSRSRERAAPSEAAPCSPSPGPAEPPREAASALHPEPRPDPAPRSVAADRIYRGRLIDHGVDRYQFDPHQDESYYVILDTTQQGEQVIWGKDLQRAMEQSLSRVREGQEVVVRQLGARPVTVSRPIRDVEGQIVTHTQVKTHLNRWLVETEAFLREREKLADVVRDVGIDPKTAVARHPELAGTYAELHAARLVALQQNYRHPADLERFVNRTREGIAQEIERGEPLSAPFIRARYQGPGTASQRAQERAQQRTL
jgi:hypothetical protein